MLDNRNKNTVPLADQCNPTGPITYRTLAAWIALMNDEQLDMDIVVEDLIENECYPAELRIAGSKHDMLDENHPVICIEFYN